MHVPTAGMTKVQPVNVAEVISMFAVLTTLAVNEVLLHIDQAPVESTLNPKLVEVSVWCEPTTPQLEAEAIDGTANAHTAIAPAKSKTPFLENSFMTNNSL